MFNLVGNVRECNKDGRGEGETETWNKLPYDIQDSDSRNKVFALFYEEYGNRDWH